MRTSALFGAKTLDFSKYLWCVRTVKGVWASADKGGGGVNFVRTSFMDGP